MHLHTGPQWKPSIPLSLRSRQGEAVFLAGRSQAPKIQVVYASGVREVCHDGRCQRLQYAPKMIGKRVAFDLSLEILPPASHNVPSDVGCPFRQVHRDKDGQQRLRSFGSTNMRAGDAESCCAQQARRKLVPSAKAERGGTAWPRVVLLFSTFGWHVRTAVSNK